MANLLWLCHIFPKKDLLSDFVSKRVEASSNILYIIKDMIFVMFMGSEIEDARDYNKVFGDILVWQCNPFMIIIKFLETI